MTAYMDDSQVDSDHSISDAEDNSDIMELSELLEVCKENGIFIRRSCKQVTPPHPSTSNDCASTSTEIRLCVEENVTSSIEQTSPVASPSETPEIESRRSITLRQREKRQQDWKRNSNQQKRMRGESYLGFSKVIDGTTRRKRTPQDQTRGERTMGLPCVSASCTKSSLRNCSKFAHEDRLEIFQSFWKDMDWNAKKIFVNSHVDQISPKQRTTKHSSQRCLSLLFYLKLHGAKQQVCRNMFLSTLGMKESQMRTWILAPAGPTASKQRDKLTFKGGDKMFYKEFLENIPKLPSHYCRSDTSKLYFEHEFRSKQDVYNAYKSECSDRNIPVTSYNTFCIYLREKNFAIHQPKKDYCDVCASHDEGNLTDEVYQKHLEKKNDARNEKSSDKDLAARGSVHVLTMDVQKVLLSPMLNASALYYKTKLAIHNFTMFDLNTLDTTCYLWNESQSDLVASSFASCVINFLERKYDDDLPIILYSDGCTSQNRNSTMSGALLHFAVKHQKTVIQKYLEKGHTQMECDSVHSLLEKKISGRSIYLPSDYTSIFRSAREKPKPYEVKELCYKDFFDYSGKKANIRPGSKTNDPVVTDVRQLRYNKDATIDYKLNHKDKWSQMPRKYVVNVDIDAPLLHSSPLSIPKRKYQDLQNVLHVLPESCHEYYTKLPFK